jgi:cytochrome c-type biogenesis protein CcmH
MTVFWLIAAALVLVPLALLLRPLLRRQAGGEVSRDAVNVSIYRDQLRELEADLAAGTLARADYDRARAELEARMLQDVAEPAAPRARAAGRKSLLAIGLAVPLVAAGVYLTVGNPGALQGDPGGVSVEQVEAMVAGLAARLRENPDDLEGWKMLGRSYAVLGRFAEAADAYAKAAVRAPRDAQLLADLADVLAMARGQNLQGEPEKLVLRALEIDPNNLKALALAGTAAFGRKEFGAAARYWERMLAHVPPDSEDARTIRENVDEARRLADSGAAPLRGTVSLSPRLKDQAAPDDVVFVFARAADGPAAPLAVAKTRVRDLPYRFSLDDSMAMTPAMRLSAFPRVIVGARVSKSGTAAAQPGDLQGASAPVANNAASVEVVIDSTVR